MENEGQEQLLEEKTFAEEAFVDSLDFEAEVDDLPI